MQQIKCEIQQVEKLNDDVYRVSLSLPEAVQFKAGQYLEIVLPDDRKAAFSIGSAPESDRALELHVREVPDSEMSSAILAQLKEGQSLTVELPKGDTFVEASQLKDDEVVILAAASTGFSQIKSMTEHLLASGVKNPIHVYWGARVAADLYLPELPESWAKHHDNLTFHPVVSEPGDRCDWTGRVDLLPDAITADFDAFDKAAVFASGSPAMVYALLDTLEEKGLNEAQMHSDVFAYAPRPEKN